MSYKSLQKGEYVFMHGDIGDKFYLILDGSVEVQIPDKMRLNDFEQCKTDIIITKELLNKIVD